VNAGPASSGIVIGHLKVRWRVDSEMREADRARLDGLMRELCDGPLEDALTDTPGCHPAEVCIRRVVVPPHQARWDCADAELVSGWAGAIGRAVRASMVPGGDVVRFASRAHAQADLVVSVLAGDRERIWAWQLLGLWPAGDWPDAEAIVRTVAAAVRERPGALVSLAVAAARAAQLGRFTLYLGPATLAEYTQHAWQAAGGSMRPRPAAGGQADADAALTGRLAALLRRSSQILECAHRLPAVRPAGLVELDDSLSGDYVSGGSLSVGSVSGGSVSGARSGAVIGPGPLAESLAALAVLEVEPAMAAHPVAWAVVSLTARGLVPVPADVPRPPSATPGAGRRPDPRDGATAHPRPPADSDAAPVQHRAAAPAHPAADGGATPVPPGAGTATCWGGLLFLLPIVSELGIPASLIAAPGDDGTGLRPVLHELGRQLLVRAAPDAEPPAAEDPALLAFCGLSPGSEPPGPLAGPAAKRTGLAADSVVSALRARMTGPYRGDPALLLGVCRRHAVIHADPGWIDVDLRLDEVSVDVRRAALDVDPGYLPWLGCVVRFRYV
jgi:hypothetical protein